MKLETLQGLNHLASHSVVKITTDGGPKTDLIDLVQSFHSVFLNRYWVEDKSIFIETNLPQLWRETAETFNKLSTGDWDNEQAKDFLLNHIFKAQIYSMSTIPILQAAHENGLETLPLFKHSGIEYWGDMQPGSAWNRYYNIGTGSYSCITMSSGSSGDPIIANKVQRDKVRANTLAEMLKLPIAKWEKLNSKEYLKEVLDNYPKPVVIKPAGLTQGKGVTTNIYDLDHALDAFDYAKKAIDTRESRPSWQKEVMIQQQVDGDDYRLLVIDGKLEIATKRVPAFVKGDGSSTIRELIEETNKDPRRNMENPAHTLKPIEFDEMLDQYLKEQDLDLDHVPQKDEQIFVRKVASMSQGGITEDFTEVIHPQIKYVAESISATIQANVVGIDVICVDISKPLTIENGSFIEMNTTPEVYLNAFPVIGKSYEDAGWKVIKGLLKAKEPVKIIVAVGNTLDALNQHLKENGLYDGENRTGVISNSQMYINQELMSNIDDFWIGLKSMKVNSALNTLVVHYNSWDEVKEHGLGFDTIDLLLSEAVNGEFQKYVDDGLIKEVKNIN